MQVVANEFYQRKEIKDIVAYLHLALNPADDVAFARMVSTPLRSVEVQPRPPARLRRARRSRSRRRLRADALADIRTRKGLTEFAGLLGELSSARDLDAAVAFNLVLESIDVGAGWRRWTTEPDLRPRSDVENSPPSRRTTVLATPRASSGACEEVALVADADGGAAAEDAVKLAALHARKRLGPFVAIAGVGTNCSRERAVEAEPAVAIERASLLRRHLGPGASCSDLPHVRELLRGGRPRCPRAARAPRRRRRRVRAGRRKRALGAFDGSSGAGAGLAVGDLVIHHPGRGTIEQLAGAGINARGRSSSPRRNASSCSPVLLLEPRGVSEGGGRRPRRRTRGSCARSGAPRGSVERTASRPSPGLCGAGGGVSGPRPRALA